MQQQVIQHTNQLYYAHMPAIMFLQLQDMHC